MIFWKLCYKISPFWAFFLEFFGLGNNLTLQDHYYTRTISLILGIERNKKSDFNGAFLARLARILTNFLRRKTRILQDFLLLPKTLVLSQTSQSKFSTNQFIVQYRDCFLDTDSWSFKAEFSILNPFLFPFTQRDSEF